MVIDGETILQTLVLNEHKAAEVYGLFAERYDGEMKELFEELLEDELRHERMYRAVLTKHQETHTPVPEDEAEYIKLLMSNNLFSKDGLTADEVDNMLKKMTPLEIAERIEVDAIFYATELQRLYPGFAQKETEVIVAEERKHLQKVFRLKHRGVGQN